VNERLENLWLDIVQLASTISFSNEEDSLIWQFSSNGVYSSQSFYKVSNFRGILPVYTPAVWELKIPPRVQFFLWLLSKNKVLTRDNLAKRRKLEDECCLFCCEKETSQHLFFNCVVAVNTWENISHAVGRNIGGDFESIGTCWLSNKRFLVINMLCAAALWFFSLWKLRNNLCFNNVSWQCLEALLMKIVMMVQNWTILCPDNMKQDLAEAISKLKQLASRPGRLTC
jgi:hypothetical protein